MAVELASGYVSIVPSTKGFGSALDKQIGPEVDKAARDAGSRAGDGFTSSFGSGLGKLAAIAATAFAGLQVGNFFKGTITAASDLNETVNKVSVVFGDSAGVVQDWGKTAATALGQSTQQALEAAGTFGNLFRAMGLTSDVSAGMSTKLVGLAADLASFNNANPADVLVALKSGLVGETEPLRQFGVNLNDARIKAEALRLGLVDAAVDQNALSAAQEAADKAARKVADALKTSGAGSQQFADASLDAEQANNKLADVLGGKMPAQLDAATKAQAAYSLIMQDTSLAQGDFARTSGGLANQLRILQAQLKDSSAKLGQALLPATVKIVTFLTSKGIPAFEKFAEALIVGIGKQIGKIADGLQIFRQTLKGSVKAVPGIKNLNDVFAHLADFVEAVRKHIRGLGVAFLVFSGPVGLAALALIKNFDKVKEAFRDFVAGFTGKVAPTGFFSTFGDAVGKLVGLVPGALKSVGKAVDDFAKGFSGAGIGDGLFSKLGEEARKAVGVAEAFLTAGASAATAFISGLVTGVVGADLSGVDGVAATIGTVLRQAFDDVKGAIDNSRQTIVDIFKFVDDHKDAFTVAAAGLAAFITSLKTINTVETAVSGIQAAFATLATLGPSIAPLLANPFGLVAAAVVAVAVAAFVAYKKFKPFRDIVDATGRVIRDVAVVSFEKLKDIITTVAPIVGGAFVTAFHAVSGAISTAIGAIVSAFNTVKAAVGTAFGAVRDAISTAVSFIGGVAGNVIDALQPAINWFNDNFVATFQAGIEFLVASFQDFRGRVATAVSIISTVFGKLASIVQTIASAIGSVLGPIFERLGAFLGDVGRLTASLIVPAFQFFATVIGQLFKVTKAFLAFVIPAWTTFSRIIIDVVVFAFEQVKSTIENTLGVIRGIFKILTGIVKGDWGKIWDGVKTVVSSTFGVVIDTIKNFVVLAAQIITDFDFAGFGQKALEFGKVVLEALGQILVAIIKWVADAAPKIAAQVLEWGVALSDWVLTSALPWLLEKLGQFAIGLLKWLIQLPPLIAVKAAELANPLVDWVLTTALPWLLDKLGQLVVAFGKWVADNAPDIALKLLSWAVALSDWVLTSALPWLLEKLGGLLAALFDWVTTSAASLATKASEFAGSILSWIGQAVIDAPGKLAELATAILGFFTGLPEKITTAAAGMWDGIYDAFKGALNLVIRAWNGLDFTVGAFHIPGTDKDFGGFTIGTPDIPELAGGGVFSSPFTGMLKLAETPAARPEIVTPQKLLAATFRKELATVGAGGGGGVQFGDIVVNGAQASPASIADAVFAKAGWLHFTGRREL